MSMRTATSYSPSEKQDIFVRRTQERYPAVWQAYCDMAAHDKFSADELHDFNFRQRIEILRYAYENTVFYRRLYDRAGVRPEDVRSEDDWDRLPIVTKDDVRQHGDEMCVGGMNGELVRKFGRNANTGGSTGKPLRIFRDSRYLHPAHEWREQGWMVRDFPCIGQSEGCVWRMSDQQVDAKKIEQERKLIFPMERFYLDAWQMTEDRMRQFMQDITAGAVVGISAYTGAMDELAHFCRGQGIRPPRSLKWIKTMATVLTPTIRANIENAFGCKVYDVYSARETQPMAVECCCGNGKSLHVQSDLRHIDLTDESGAAIHDEREGRVVVTVFTNKVMPFVRYEIGDRTHFISRPCECGLSFPLIAPVSGRESSCLVDVFGQRIFGVTAPFDDVPHCCSAFQYVQRCPGHVTIRVVPCRDYPRWQREIEAVRQKWTTRMAGRIKFDVEYVESIPHDGGKLRFIVQK